MRSQTLPSLSSSSSSSSARRGALRIQAASSSPRQQQQQQQQQRLPEEPLQGPDFSSLVRPDNTFTIAGFGSLLSVRSAAATFPRLSNFRVGTLRGWRRVFAHTTSIFHVRGVARGREAASLSIEEAEGDSASNSLIVSLFEVPFSEEAAAALLEREHEFRFVSVKPLCRAGIVEEPHRAVACASWNDGEYRALRIRDEEDWRGRYSGVSALGEEFSISRVWEKDGRGSGDKTDESEMILPCRAYLRHVVLAARSLGEDAERCVLDNTFLADRRTTVREHLERDPSVMLELPPPGLESRYGG